jgi:hypothetical protein
MTFSKSSVFLTGVSVDQSATPPVSVTLAITVLLLCGAMALAFALPVPPMLPSGLITETTTSASARVDPAFATVTVI